MLGWGAPPRRYFERHRGWLFVGVRTMRYAFFLDELDRYASKLQVTVAPSEEAPPAKTSWPWLRFESSLVHEVAKRAMAG